VRREQRLSYHVVFLLLACVLPVPAHVNAAVRHFRVKLTVLSMGLEENCKTYLGKLVAAKPVYGWGWTRLDAPEIPVPAQINGVPFPFQCRIEKFFDSEDELRGFIGRVEQAEHIYDGLRVSIYTRVVGTFNFTDALPYCNFQLGTDEPSGEFLQFVSGSPIVNGYGFVGATFEHITEYDKRIGALGNNAVPNKLLDTSAKQRLS